MGAFFSALVVIIPIVEIVLFALVADRIGVLPTVAALILISAAGAILLIREGIGAWRRLRETIRRRETPTDELADAALIAVGGLLLLTPGFFTDALAFLVVMPPTRRSLRKALKSFATGFAAARLGWRGKTAVGAKKAYDVHVTRTTRRGSDPPGPPPQLPSATRPAGEDGSPDRG